ncbi:MAG TPA: hypothetical protein DEA96_11040 [Leptospiraceae bacterium]|nr:hypothetical protein [Leptospiraceae bacterium]
MIRFLFYGQEGQHSVAQASYSNPIQSLRLNAKRQGSRALYPSRKEILEALSTIDQWKESYDVICLFSYEMGCILQNVAMPGDLPDGYPVTAAYAFAESAKTGVRQNLPGLDNEALASEFYTQGSVRDDDAQLSGGFDLGPMHSCLNQTDYNRHIQSIQEKIRGGLSYQVNFTAPLRTAFSGDPEAFFHWLRKRYPSPYSVFANLGDRQIVSISPELFFSCRPVVDYAPLHGEELFRKHHNSRDRRFADGFRLEVRPMKGTVRATKDNTENESLKRRLLESEKDRAELAMITDLLRNDLGRISPAGGVSLEKAIQPESYTYVHQLTSVISAFHPTGRLSEMIPSLFPSGSITGAPRIETMKIIAEEESEYRGIYTGSIGLIRSNEVSFNVAIRTAEISRGMLRYGAGGGITLGSEAGQEWKELHWKVRPVKPEKPGLIETMALVHGRIKNRKLHIQRMLRSGRVLRLPCPVFEARKDSSASPDRDSSPEINRANLTIQIQRLTQYLDQIQNENAIGRFRLRLHWQSNGTFSYSISRQEPRRKHARNSLWKIKIAESSMSSRDPWLLHKVDRRKCYNEGLAIARDSGYDEDLFFNERNEITEGSITNVFYMMDQRWYTPPIRCGLLAGVQRSRLLSKWGHRISFRPLKKSELETVQRIVLVNSLRGLIEASL